MQPFAALTSKSRKYCHQVVSLKAHQGTSFLAVRLLRSFAPPAYAGGSDRPSFQRAPLQRASLHLMGSFLIASVALAAVLFLAPQTSALAGSSAFAQEEKRAEREAAQRAKAEAAAKQQASPEAAQPQGSPEGSGATTAKGEKKSGEGDDENKPDDNKPKDPMSSPTFNGLKFRSIGPAFTSGRVIGFAVDPNNPARYFVAAASGGVWKTVNNGTTWTPVFDREGSYSIGAIALDPKNPLTVWVGTGENNSQRSVSYGNGLYRSDDGGKTWKNVGTENFRAHRPHRHRSKGFKHRLRGRAGTAVGSGRRSRSFQNH